MEFEEACSEMDYILEHMNPIDKLKIPKNIIQFFKENKSITYKVELDVTKNLKEQELKDETKVFIKLLNAKFFANKTVEKDSDYTLFKKEKEIEIENNKALTVIEKENRLILWVKKIFKKMFKKHYYKKIM